jgi:DNA-binding transcriptional MerR regulator
MRSGQLARLTGLSTDTLRHYERLGILPLPQRTSGNYREYLPTSRQRVELIQRALAVGFSLTELKSILAVRDKGGAPCWHVRALMRAKIRDVNEHIRNLAALRVELKRLSKEWDRRLRRTKAGQLARLLEAVPWRAGSRVAPGFPRLRKKKGQ